MLHEYDMKTYRVIIKYELLKSGGILRKNTRVK